ncbi:MAG: hypothetical protein LBM95_01540 [Lactobacillales bacterium]|jgi:hypothetical protein|nr:hypothetical protein [Lactobacillales bacterium]
MRKNVHLVPAVAFLGTSVLMILPQMMGRGVILGSDSLFHFNRFYDTAMQIKNLNLQYFTSFYGFAQTGRIVNAFYGPLVAYFQGILVLLAGSWFNYQVLSNVILYLLSGCSMYVLLSKSKVRQSISVPLSILYMMTFAIQYWTLRQGFTSWGASLFPICLLPVNDMIQRKEVRSLPLGILTALMVQTHMLSSLFLVAIYVPCFLYAFFKSEEKGLLLRNLALAIGIFLLLTMNLWVGMFELYKGNTILAPFVNKTPELSTIDWDSYYWLVTPGALLGILLFQFFYVVRYHKRVSFENKLLTTIACVFVLLSSSLIPWNRLVADGFILAELVQFPFRFFVPATVLFLFSFALTLEEGNFKSLLTKICLWTIVIFSLAQDLVLVNLSVRDWQKHGMAYVPGRETFATHESESEIKAAFFTSDLSVALEYLQKPTPDYLPVYRKTNEDKYAEYKKVLLRNNLFTKTVDKDKLIVEWQAEKVRPTEVPVIKYANTELTLNGKTLSEKECNLSNLGVVNVPSVQGKNRLTLRYNSPKGFNVLLLATLGMWGISLFLLVKRR